MKNRFPADLFGRAGRLFGKRHRNIAKSDPKWPPTAAKVNQNAAKINKKNPPKTKNGTTFARSLFFTRLPLILLLFGFAALRPTTFRHNYAKIKGRRGPRSVYNNNNNSNDNNNNSNSNRKAAKPNTNRIKGSRVKKGLRKCFVFVLICWSV